jgi:hypothetical protein
LASQNRQGSGGEPHGPPAPPRAGPGFAFFTVLSPERVMTAAADGALMDRCRPHPLQYRPMAFLLVGIEYRIWEGRRQRREADI